MRTCPSCRSTDVYSSHRRGLVERALLAWVGVYPYRCGQCRTRFYRLAVGGYRRRISFAKPVEMFAPRPARWPLAVGSEVTVLSGDPPPAPLQGVTENVSLDGLRVRLPSPIRPGTQVRVRLGRETPRPGRVRWSRDAGDREARHGIQFTEPIARRHPIARPIRRLLWRQRWRRLWLWVGGLFLMAVAAYGLVWLMEALRTYNPSFYEPKDIERQERREQSRPGGP